MTDFLAFTIVGIVTGAIYAIAASGLVVTYTTSGIFNFAHGAVGMVMAFLYWELTVERGLPEWLGFVLVVFVTAPLFGAVVERVLMRRLHGQSTGVSLVVTVGLLVLLLGLGQTVWPGTVARRVPELFADRSITVASVVVSFHNLAVILTAAGVAFFLRILLFRTRVGIAMRAVVDDRELAAQNGAFPERVAQLSWAIGSMLGAVAGILLAPQLTLNHLGLTLLVVNGYAAAMLGRLRSLPLTFVGALALGLGEAYLVGFGSRVDFGTGVFGNSSALNELRPALPTLFLFAFLVFLPQVRLRAGRLTSAATPRVPGLRQSLVGAAVFVGVAASAAPMLSGEWLFNTSTALAFAMVALSLVLLTGYAGQVSLCQFTFVGIGAVMMGKLAPGGGVGGVIVAGVVAAAVGALVALPALRLQDLYLALTTVAVALLADNLFFDHPKLFETGIAMQISRLRLLGVSFEGERAQLLMLAVVFAAMAIGVLAIRRGAFGRRLAAMRDSPAACATLGMNMVTTKVAVFAVSAGLAGIAGALFGGIRGSASRDDFLMLQSLFLFLLAMFGGITSVSGALVAGAVFSVLPVVQAHYFSAVDLRGLFIGAGAIVISRYPNGFAGIGIDAVRRLRLRLRLGARAPAGPTAVPPLDVELAEVPA